MTNFWNLIKTFIAQSKNLGILGITTYSATMISAVFFIYLAPLMGPEKYGELSYLYSIANIAFALCFFGGGTVILVYIPKGIKLFPAISIISLLSCFVGSVVVFFFLNNISLSILILTLSISNLAINELIAKQQFKTHSKYVLSQRISFVVLALVLFHLFDVNGLILGLGISNLIFIFIIIRGFKETKIDFSLVKPRIKFMLYSYGIWITRVAYGYADRIIISPLYGFEILGNYELAGQIVGFMYIFPIIIHNFVQPRDAKSIPTTKIKIGAILASMLIAILVAILAPTILPLIFNQFLTTISFISIMAFAIVPHTLSRVTASRFLGNEQSTIVILGSGIHFSTLIIGIIVLGGYYGIVGVAISFLISEILEAVFLSISHKLKFKTFL